MADRVLENHLEQSSSRRDVTEDLPRRCRWSTSVTYGGPLDGAGERESTPCDALGGEECWPLNCSHMCTAVCIVGVERAFAAVKMMVATLCSALDAYSMLRVLSGMGPCGVGGSVGSMRGSNMGSECRAPCFSVVYVRRVPR
jgi:hypothetical protein